MRVGRPLVWALALSLIAHLSLLFGLHVELPQWAPPPPLTVALQAPPPQVKPIPRPRVAAAPRAKPARAPKPIAVAETAPATPDIPVDEGPSEPAPVEPPPPPPAPAISEPAIPPSPAPPEEIPMERHADFPSSMELVFTVYRGEQGLVLGKTVHTWLAAKGQYLLTSTTEATGLFSLFFSGRYIQTSRGSLTPRGLQPKEFWIQRGQDGNRTEFADFDWAAQRLTFGKSGEDQTAVLPDGTQDQLSALYQLALTAPRSGRFKLAITTGRRLHEYEYQALGEEMLQTPLGPLKTLHLGKVVHDKDQDSAADVWLALDHHGIPVRFKLTTSKGEILDHVLSEWQGL